MSEKTLWILEKLKKTQEEKEESHAIDWMKSLLVECQAVFESVDEFFERELEYGSKCNESV